MISGVPCMSPVRYKDPARVLHINSCRETPLSVIEGATRIGLWRILDVLWWWLSGCWVADLQPYPGFSAYHVYISPSAFPPDFASWCFPTKPPNFHLRGTLSSSMGFTRSKPGSCWVEATAAPVNLLAHSSLSQTRRKNDISISFKHHCKGSGEEHRADWFPVCLLFTSRYKYNSKINRNNIISAL